jgi:hypothetical protein
MGKVSKLLRDLESLDVDTRKAVLRALQESLDGKE